MTVVRYNETVNVRGAPWRSHHVFTMVGYTGGSEGTGDHVALIPNAGVIEAEHYGENARALALTPEVISMAFGLPAGTDTYSHEFMLAAAREYAARGGRVPAESLGAVPRAIRLVRPELATVVHEVALGEVIEVEGHGTWRIELPYSSSHHLRLAPVNALAREVAARRVEPPALSESYLSS